MPTPNLTDLLLSLEENERLEFSRDKGNRVLEIRFDKRIGDKHYSDTQGISDKDFYSSHNGDGLLMNRIFELIERARRDAPLLHVNAGDKVDDASRVTVHDPRERSRHQ